MYYKKLILSCGLFCLIFGSDAVGYTAGHNYTDKQGYSPRVGEVLTYKVIAKSFIYGADQTLKVISKSVLSNHNVFNVQYTFNTVGLVWNLTKYHEREELALDEEGMYPLYTKRDIYEGSKQLIEETTFDYILGRASRKVTNNGIIESSEIKLPGYVQDSLSLEFFLRKSLLEEGRKKLYFYSLGTIMEVDYEVTKIKAPLKLECGNYAQYYQIVSDESKITIILADNPERLPLIIRKIAGFGKVEAQLSTIN
jgi:hypothetical protein